MFLSLVFTWFTQGDDLSFLILISVLNDTTPGKSQQFFCDHCYTFYIVSDKQAELLPWASKSKDCRIRKTLESCIDFKIMFTLGHSGTEI